VPLTPEEIDRLARGPKTATGDMGSFTEQDADDTIKLDQYSAAKTAAENGRPPMRILKIVPPGSV